jgi:hypothetical protein
MTPDGFRKLALSLPEAAEGEHMDHPDFRVKGKIFATLHPDGEHGVVMLSPRQQREFLLADPKAFIRINGAWGRLGVKVRLKSVKSASARAALRQAWQNRMLKSME